MHSDSNQNWKKHTSNQKPLIAIIDDDRDNLLLASCVVESMGMDYVITNDSEQCLSLVRELLPDIILLDIVMPNMNGIEIASILKQDRHCAQIAIIAVTGLTKPEDKERLIAAGFDDYLSKPYLIEELEAKIYGLLKYS